MATSPRHENVAPLSSQTTTWPAWIRTHRAALARGDRRAWAQLDAAIHEIDTITDAATDVPSGRHLTAVPHPVTADDTKGEDTTTAQDVVVAPPVAVDLSAQLADLIAHHTRMRDLTAVIDTKTTAPEHRAQAQVALADLIDHPPVHATDGTVLVQGSDAAHPQARAVIDDPAFADALAAAQPTITWTPIGPHVEQPRGVSAQVRRWMYSVFTKAGRVGLTSSEVRNLATRRFPVGTPYECHHGVVSSHLNVLEGLGFISRATDPRHPGKAITRPNQKNRQESVYFLVPGQQQAFADYLTTLTDDSPTGTTARDQATGRTQRTVRMPDPEPAPVDQDGIPMLFAS